MNMIERAARELAFAAVTIVGPPEYRNTCARKFADENWTEYVHQVRAVILSMREPSEGMVDASWHSAGESKEMRPRTHAHYKRHYQAMIDAALTE